MTPPTGTRIGVVGSGHGALAIALARASPAAIVAGFDPDAVAIAVARRAAAIAGVSDRVTFEVASRGVLLGEGYDLIIKPAGVTGLTRPCPPEWDCAGRSNARA